MTNSILIIAHHREQSISTTYLANTILVCEKVSDYGYVSVKIIL